MKTREDKRMIKHEFFKFYPFLDIYFKKSTHSFMLALVIPLGAHLVYT